MIIRLIAILALNVLALAHSFGEDEVFLQPVNAVETLALSPGSKVLFIGDEYTSGQGGVDAMVRELSVAAGHPLDVSSRAFAGYDFSAHLADLPDPDGATLSDRLAETWDVVVLQDAAQAPLDDLVQHSADADQLVGLVRGVTAYSADDCEPLFGMTWPDKNLDLVMTKPLVTAYTENGHRNLANVAPVGAAWQKIIDLRPDIELYIDDQSPSLTGQYLSACVYYVALTGNSVSGNAYAPAGVSASNAKYLQETVDAVMADYFVSPTNERVLKSLCAQHMVDLGLDPSTDDQTDERYAEPFGHFVYLPPSYHAFAYKKYPLLLVSAGKGEDGNGEEDLGKALRHGPAKIVQGRDSGDAPTFRYGTHFHDMIIVTAQFPEEDPLTLAPKFESFIKYLEIRYRIDPNHIMMTGLSGGASRAWTFAAEMAGRFSAIAPIATRTGLTEAQGLKFIDADGALRTRVWAFHSNNDGNLDKGTGALYT